MTKIRVFLASVVVLVSSVATAEVTTRELLREYD
jgi:hypothetical protein